MSHFANTSGAPLLVEAPRSIAPRASAEREWLADPEELRARLASLFADPTTVALARTPEGHRVRATCQWFEPGAAHPCVFGFPRPPPLPTQVILASPFAAYSFEVQELVPREDAWAAGLPAGVRVWRRRAERRQCAPAGMEARIGMTGEPLGSAPLPVCELSFRSLCLTGWPPIPVGARVRIEVTTSSREVLSLEGRVARIAGEGEGVKCALALDPEAALQPGWQTLVCRALHPHTRRGKTWAAASWALYESSGYFHLSSQAPHRFTRLKSAFAQACRKLDHAPELGGQIAWPSARGIEASLSLLRVYADTSFVYQVARRRDPLAPSNGREVLRAVNLHAFEQVARDPSPGWLLIYIQDDGARWSRLAYRSFGEGLGPERGCVVPFRAILHRAGPSVWRGREGLTVLDPSPDECRQVLAQLERSRPAVYLDALDLRPGRLHLREVEDAWRRRGLNRRRAVRLLLHRGRPVALSVLERADEGLHLFGLLDCARLYPLRPGAEVYLPLLLDDARGWFHAQGKERFVYFAEDEAASPPVATQGQPLGGEDLGGARLVAFPKRELPAFLDHLHRITAPRPERAR